MICKMAEARPKAIESTLEDIDLINVGSVLEIHVMQLNCPISNLSGSKKFDYGVFILEKDCNSYGNGPLVPADEVRNVYDYLKEYAQNRGITVVDSANTDRYRFN